MRISKLFGGLAIATVCTVANSAALVTLNPAANGIGGGAVFNTTGGTLFLGQTGTPALSQTTLTINGTSGSGVSYTESGRIFVESFRDSTIGPGALALPGFNAYPNAGQWGVYIDFTLSGVGFWSGAIGAGGTFSATSASLASSMWANPVGAGPNLKLATLTLSNVATAIAVTFGTPTLGSALTSFSGIADFTPEAGTTGLGNFFQAPSPFLINVSLGNVGGNFQNTGYSVVGTTVSMVVPINGAGTSGTGNFEFINKPVPEPGALALVAIALVGAGVATRRSSRKTPAAA